jgi:glycosyltransferase involved in cell wall biosynthesis
MTMRICIPIEFQAQGGGFYFLEGFATYLGQAGWEVSQIPESAYEVLFTNHWMTPYADILRAIRRNPNVRIIQRIDGAAENYGRDAEADRRQAQVNQMADLTIFQSRYARYSTREKFPIIKQDGPIIYNPVDLDTFRPDGERREFPRGTQVVCVTWSKNPYKGLSNVYAVIKDHPDVDFVLCGSFEDAPDLANVHNMGLLNRSELAAALRSCQVLLTFSRNEACPNHVLEALASGLPVLYEDSGAMREVVADCGLPVTVEDFAEQLGKLMADRGRLSKAARQRAVEWFNPQANFHQYVQAIESSLARPSQVPSLWRSALAWSHPVLQRARGV